MQLLGVESQTWGVQINDQRRCGGRHGPVVMAAGQQSMGDAVASKQLRKRTGNMAVCCDGCRGSSSLGAVSNIEAQ